MFLLSIFADFFEWRKHTDSQTHLTMFVPSKYLLLFARTGFRSKQQEGLGLGLIHTLPQASECWAVPKLQAFFESLAQGDFFLHYLFWSNANICLLRNTQRSEVINPPSAYDEPTPPVKSRIQVGSLFLLISGKSNWRWGPALFELPHAKMTG